MEHLTNNLRNVLIEYIRVFCEKQGFDFEDSIDYIGGSFDILNGCIFFGDYNFSIGDIVYDIDNNIEKGFIIKWFEDSFYSFLDKETRYINYKSYYKGLRYNIE